MKIEAGKYYRSRNGKKCYVACRDPFNCENLFPFCGFSQEGNHTWTESGRYYESGNESLNDLIEEWNEPTQVPLELDDIVPGTVICAKGGHGFTMITVADEDGVFLENRNSYSYKDLMDSFNIRLPGSDEWVPCSKEG